MRTPSNLLLCLLLLCNQAGGQGGKGGGRAGRQRSWGFAEGLNGEAIYCGGSSSTSSWIKNGPCSRGQNPRPTAPTPKPRVVNPPPVYKTNPFGQSQYSSFSRPRHSYGSYKAGLGQSYGYRVAGHGTQWGTVFSGGVGLYTGSSKALGLGVGAAFLGGAVAGAADGVAATLATYSVYHRWADTGVTPENTSLSSSHLPSRYCSGKT